MKLVAPADIKGRSCSSMRQQCRQLVPTAERCKLYDVTLKSDDAPPGDLSAKRPMKCSACVDALDELEDR